MAKTYVKVYSVDPEEFLHNLRQLGKNFEY